MKYITALKYFLPLLIFLFSKQTALAAANGSLEASPVFTEVVLDKPDEVKQIILTYKNNSTKPITLEIFPIDFKQADITGAINFLGTESGSFSYSLSSYLSFESNTLQLDAGSEKKFMVTVKNREDLSPGGHYAAVIARLQSTAQSDAGQAQVAPSISSLILLRKEGGERFNLSLSDLKFPDSPLVLEYPVTITALFKNEGNIHLVPFGVAEIRDIFGRQIYKGTINSASLRVFPESRRYIDIDMYKTDWSLPISLNSITIKGQDSLKKADFSYRDNFLYVNPVFVFFLILGIIVFIVVKRNKKSTPVKVTHPKIEKRMKPKIKRKK